MKTFSAPIVVIGINPCVVVPDTILKKLMEDAGKAKGPIPVRGTLNGKKFKQTVVKYSGAWRLYLNTPMRQGAGIDTGDTARIRIEFDRVPRAVPMHPRLALALRRNRRASAAFRRLPPYRRKEILRYLNALRTADAVSRTIKRVLRHLK